MTRELGELLGRYGRDLLIHYGGGRADAEARGLLAPMEGWEDREAPTPLGVMRRDRFLYLGDPAVEPGKPGEGYMECGGGRYRVRAAELVHIGREASHWRAVLERE